MGDALAEHISLGNALVSQIHLGLDPVGTQQLIPAVLGYNVVLQDGAVKLGAAQEHPFFDGFALGGDIAANIARV